MIYRFRYAHEGAVKPAPKAGPLGKFGRMLPHKIFIFRAREMSFPMFSWGKVHKSEHEKNANYSNT